LPGSRFGGTFFYVQQYLRHQFRTNQNKNKILSYFPKLCLWSVAKAIIAATVWTIADENNAHKKV